MKSIIKKAFLLFTALKNKVTKKLDKLIEAEPQVKGEYVDKVVYLLRRDFPIQEQNEIMLSVAKKLAELREADMRKMEETYKVIQEESNNFKARLVIQ
jgi:hypothetical protein